MTLSEYVEHYNLARDIKPTTLEHYRWVVHSLNSFLGRQINLSELSAELLNRYLLWLRDSGRSPFTCKQRRASLLVLWRSAADDGYAAAVEKVRRVKVPDPPREVWSREEVSRLIDSASVLDGQFRTLRINRVTYFRTLIAAAYDSGLRRSDLHQLPMSIATSDAPASVVQIKTGRCVVARFHAATREAIRQFLVDQDRQLIWPVWSQHRGVFARMFRKIVIAAGLRGTFSKLRKTSGTEVERCRPGVAWRHLGHSTPDTARVWYINEARAYEDVVPLPPALPS